MKPLLRSLAILSIVLFSQFGQAADLILPATATTQIATAAQDLRSKAAPGLTAVQLVISDGTTNAASGGLREAAGAVGKSSAEGLPSTPIALATLLLIICILIGRRNT